MLTLGADNSSATRDEEARSARSRPAWMLGFGILYRGCHLEEVRPPATSLGLQRSSGWRLLQLFLYVAEPRMGGWTAASFPSGIARGSYLKLECISVARSKDLLPSCVPAVENIGAADGWQLSTDGKHRMPDASQMPVANSCSNAGCLPSPAAKNTSPTVNIAFLVQGFAPFSPSAPFSTLPALVTPFCLVPCLSGPLFYTRYRRPLPLSLPVAFRFPQSLFFSFSLSARLWPRFNFAFPGASLFHSPRCSYERPFVLFCFNPSPNCRFSPSIMC